MVGSFFNWFHLFRDTSSKSFRAFFWDYLQDLAEFCVQSHPVDFQNSIASSLSSLKENWILSSSMILFWKGRMWLSSKCSNSLKRSFCSLNVWTCVWNSLWFWVFFWIILGKLVIVFINIASGRIDLRGPQADCCQRLWSFPARLLREVDCNYVLSDGILSACRAGCPSG